MDSEGQWVPHHPETWPFKFGELAEDKEATRWDSITRQSYPYTIPAGTTVRIVMVSRLGHFGITEHVEEEWGYTACYPQEEMETKLLNLRATR